jgi:hypothetical protein
VTIGVWQDYMGSDDTLAGDGRPFAAVAQERTSRAASVERCRREIAAIEALLRNGHPDIGGLCLALADWHAELRLLTGMNRDTAACPNVRW